MFKGYKTIGYVAASVLAVLTSTADSGAYLTVS